MKTSTCTKGAKIEETDEETTFSADQWMTGREYFGTKREMVDCYCDIICSRTQQNVCHLLNK